MKLCMDFYGFKKSPKGIRLSEYLVSNEFTQPFPFTVIKDFELSIFALRFKRRGNCISVRKLGNFPRNLFCNLEFSFSLLKGEKTRIKMQVVLSRM